MLFQGYGHLRQGAARPREDRHGPEGHAGGQAAAERGRGRDSRRGNCTFQHLVNC